MVSYSTNLPFSTSAKKELNPYGIKAPFYLSTLVHKLPLLVHLLQEYSHYSPKRKGEP